MLSVGLFPGVLKLYLRELPEPLMSSDLYNDWFQTLQRLVPVFLSGILVKFPFNLTILRYLKHYNCWLVGGKIGKR